MLIGLSREILRTFGVETDEGLSLNAAIVLLRQHMPDAAELIVMCKNTGDAYEMLRGDYEMRHKIPDVWKWQLEQSRKAMDEACKSLKAFLASNGMEQLSDAYLTEF